MNDSTFNIRIENGTRTDWLDLNKSFGNDAVSLDNSKVSSDTSPAFGEPVFTTIIVALGAVAATAFVSWVCKQRSLQRKTLRITISNPNGVSTVIDFSDQRYHEGEADTPAQLLLASFGLQQPIDSSCTNPQQLFFAACAQAQLTKLLELGNQLRHDGHQAFAANVIQQFPQFAQLL